MRVHEDSSALGKQLADISFPEDTSVGALIREGELMVPRGSSRMELGDRVYLFGRTDRINDAQDLLSRGNDEVRVAMYADKTLGALLASGLNAHDIETLMIVEDPSEAEELALALPKSEVLNGGGSDLGLMREERVGGYDIYFAVTDDDEANLMSGLLAKRLGVNRVVCLAQREDFADIYRELGIDVVLSPRQIAADQIISFTRTEPVENFVHLHNGKAEIIEVIAAEKSPITKKPLRKMSLPEGVFLGGILRKGVAIIPTGDTRVESGDLVVVMTLTKMRSKAQKLFRKGLF
jgi:trk system potassium uptake protein TrkA